jgi:glutamate formiminotransferase
MIATSETAEPQLVECVPNFSEGARPEVMDAIQSAAASVAGALVLDRHADAVHNRMVLTIAGAPGPVAEAAFRATARAAELIDLNQHKGVHPRIGATDVVPFVPLGATLMSVCVELAERVGRRIGAELDLPVYLYGEAAKSGERRRLPDIRRGEYERLRDAIPTDPSLAPDFGPARIGPAGATVVGARPPLIAYNVTLATSDIDVARRIARSIRESSGGLPAVQARGFLTADPNIVQVSMNLLDTRRSPMLLVFERIREEAAQAGVEVLESELVGMAPAEALVDVARTALRFGKLDANQVLETRLLEHALARQ